MADDETVDEVPEGHYRDAVTGEVKPKRKWETPAVTEHSDTVIQSGNQAGQETAATVGGGVPADTTHQS